MSWITDPQAWIALLTLTVLEIVLGIDNIIFITIICGKLPEEQRDKARRLGLILAVVTRLILLSSLFFLSKLDSALFTVFGKEISFKDLILMAGGLFLLWKSTHEIHKSLSPEDEKKGIEAKGSSMQAAIVWILVFDLVFSIDSVITAIGMAEHIAVMAIAVILAIGVMLWYSKAIADFVDRNPTFKMLALSFLLLIGVALLADGLGTEIHKGYIYFAMGFSFFVELLNTKLRKAKG